MNRSFLYGIIVASTTWCFSLYLYWLLTKDTTDIASNPFRWLATPNSQQYIALRHKNLSNKQNQLTDNNDKSQKMQEEKDDLYKKYKKEKKFRQISQRLIDELTPIEVKSNQGKSNNFRNLSWF